MHVVSFNRLPYTFLQPHKYVNDNLRSMDQIAHNKHIIYVYRLLRFAQELKFSGSHIIYGPECFLFRKPLVTILFKTVNLW
jgi:hypothetical protein